MNQRLQLQLISPVISRVILKSRLVIYPKELPEALNSPGQASQISRPLDLPLVDSQLFGFCNNSHLPSRGNQKKFGLAYFAHNCVSKYTIQLFIHQLKKKRFDILHFRTGADGNESLRNRVNNRQIMEFINRY